MVLWGGLKPIIIHVIVDLLALISFGYVVVVASSTKSHQQQQQQPKQQHVVVIMFSTALMLVVFSGWNFTNKWTIIFPMVPLIILQLFRQLLVLIPNSTQTTAASTSTGDAKNNNETSSKTEGRLRKPVLPSCIVILKWIIGFISLCLIFMAAALSILFPTVELPIPDKNAHIYNVGVIDLFLPSIEWNFANESPITFDPNSHENDHFAIRILYPTLDDKIGSTAYLRPHTSKAFCEMNMKYGAPPPLRKFDWIVHNWRLIQLPMKAYAQPLDSASTSTSTNNSNNNNNSNDTSSSHQGNKLLPIIIYSPGLGGSLEMYSYQTYSLASQGYVVVIVEHADGSMAVLPQKDGTIFTRNDDLVAKDFFDGNYKRHLQGRQAMTEYRSEEMISATQYMIELATMNVPELEAAGISFVGKLNTNDIHYMGHSFGGATSFHAARKSSILSKKSKSKLGRPISVIAHEPASDWIPDTTRGSLFDRKRLKNSPTNYTYWTSDVADKHPTSIHDDFDILVLFSHEWSKKKWGGVEVLQDMQQRGVFGRKRRHRRKKRRGKDNGDNSDDDEVVSRVEVIDSAHHIEFSDIAMITPTWLGRAVGLTGEKNPQHTAKDIHLKTLQFLQEVREVSSIDGFL